MEFASEMVIRASKQHLEIAEIEIEYHPRGGDSKLSSFRDGWRHLRFLLVHSPNFLFILPGAVLAAIGTIVSILVLVQVHIFGRSWDVHALIGGALLTIIGVQVLALGLCAHAYGTYFMGEKDAWFDAARGRFRLEHGLLLGGAITIGGFVTALIIVIQWIDHGFGALGLTRLAIVAFELLVVGLQIFFSSFLLSVIGLRRRDG